MEAVSPSPVLEARNAGADEMDQHRSAAIIQSHWRGAQVRKSLKATRAEPSPADTAWAPHAQHKETAPARKAMYPDGISKHPSRKTLQQAENIRPQPDHAPPPPPPPAQFGPLAAKPQGSIAHAGAHKIEDVLDTALNTLFKKRGALRAAAAKGAGDHGAAALADWRSFAERQALRHAPLAPSATRIARPEATGYRLRVLQVHGLPAAVVKGGNSVPTPLAEFRLGVSLYDDTTGTFFGNTCYSMEDTARRNPESGQLDIEFPFDVYFQTAVADPRCAAVAELIMVVKNADGAAVEEFSAGWAFLDLFKPPQQPRRSSSGSRRRSTPVNEVAQLYAGSPRYLLFKSTYGPKFKAPAMVHGCHVEYTVEAQPAMRPLLPLLPEDYLVTYTDVVPGLCRQDPDGNLSTCRKQAISLLPDPVLCQTYSVALQGMQITIPDPLHNLLKSLPELQPAPPADTAADIDQLAKPSSGVPLDDIGYIVRVGIHNGRRFVGPLMQAVAASSRPIRTGGRLVLTVQDDDLMLDWLMADVLTVVVVELLAMAPESAHHQAAEDDDEDPPQPVPVGRFAFVPFTAVAPDGCSARLAVGTHAYPFGSGADMFAALRVPPALDWRAMLGDRVARSVPDVIGTFQLAQSGREALPPRLPRDVVEELERYENSKRWQPEGKPLPLGPISEDVSPEAVAGPLVQDDRFDAGYDDGYGDGQEPLPAESPTAQELDGVPKQDSAVTLHTPATDGHTNRVKDSWAAADHKPTQHHVSNGATDPAWPEAAPPAALSQAMQHQLDQLTRAVQQLQLERTSLHNSYAALSHNSTARGLPAASASTAAARDAEEPAAPDGYDFTTGSGDDVGALNHMLPTSNYGPAAAFSGAQATEMAAAATAAPVASRALLQQMHDAGMSEGLPPDVQELLRRRPTVLHRTLPSAAPVQLEMEARDARCAADLVVQLLAYKPDTSNELTSGGLPQLTSVYFTFQLYSFPATTTEPAYLVNHMMHDKEVHMLVPASQLQQYGAGLVLKYHMDGAQDLGQHAQQAQHAQHAALEEHMRLCRYLASKTLVLDVWDGDSLLQVGTATVPLQRLLRQGREFAELLLEVPVAVAQDGVTSGGAATAGSVIVRLINIGREAVVGVKTADFDDAMSKRGRRHRVRVRAAPFQPSSPVARELADHSNPHSPFATSRPGSDANTSPTTTPHASAAAAAAHWSQGGGANGHNRPSSPLATLVARSSSPSLRRSFVALSGAAAAEPAADGCVDATANDRMAVDIISLESRKVARQRQLQEMKQGPDSPTSKQGSDHYRSVQKQLLADVDSARKRQKQDFIRGQMRKRITTRQLLRPSPGETILYHHTIQNPFDREVTLELRISHPDMLTPINSVDELTALKAAKLQTYGATEQATSETNLMAGNRLYLSPNERITVAFKLQASCSPTAGATNSIGTSGQRSAQPQHDQLKSSPDQQHLHQHQQQQHGDAWTLIRAQPSARSSVGGSSPEATAPPQGQLATIEFVATHTEHPVSVLELDVATRRMIVDRTFRLYHAEKELLSQSIPLQETTRHAGAAGGLLPAELYASCSNRDVAVSISGSGSARQLQVKLKCGGAPDVAHFYTMLYSNRQMSTQWQVWQVFVHSLRKVDISGVVGQRSDSSVVVHGGLTSRRVTCHSGNPGELQILPSSLVLEANSLAELTLTYLPTTVGHRAVRVHLVDADRHQLAHALLVRCDARLPNITRTFELRISTGQVACKKIIYVNPYQQARTLTLASSHPQLLSFQPPSLRVGPAESRQLGLVFDGKHVTAAEHLEILVYVNNDEGQNEECFQINVEVG